jgi:hypothetical protein
VKEFPPRKPRIDLGYWEQHSFAGRDSDNKAEIKRLGEARKDCRDAGIQRKIDVWIEEQKKKLASQVSLNSGSTSDVGNGFQTCFFALSLCLWFIISTLAIRGIAMAPLPVPHPSM